MHDVYENSYILINNCMYINSGCQPCIFLNALLVLDFVFQTRLVPGAQEKLVEMLKWGQINIDEGM